MTQIDKPFDAGRTDDEWLEADGCGGFASGTVGTARTRRYHAVLLAAMNPPVGRVVLVNGIEAWLEVQGQRYPLSMQRYVPDVVSPDLSACISSFDTTPWPTWHFRIDEHSVVVAELLVAKASCETVLRWRWHCDDSAARAVTLKVRLLLSGRDYHALHHENPAFNFDARVDQGQVRWQPYGDLPAIFVSTNGAYTHEPDWYRGFCYLRERERGLDFSEDLATPGVFAFNLAEADALMILSAGTGDGAGAGIGAGAGAGAGGATSAVERANYLVEIEQARRAAFGSGLASDSHLASDSLFASTFAPTFASTFASVLLRSADAYVVSRGEGHTIVAGFPWFTDWGRDTFISMRGLLLASGRHDDAEAILLAWAGALCEGMLPNRFPDSGGTPEYNAVDASLWFVIAVHEYLATNHAGDTTRNALQHTVDAILEGYTRGTRFAIGADHDGLLRAGVPGVQLTWMDAKVGDWVVTPRIGKPVEVQALWINALRIAAQWDTRWDEPAAQASIAFQHRFIDPSTGALFDVVDVDHVAGTVDRSIRPNQIFTVGGLPFSLLEGEMARAVVEQVQTHLLTPLGLRTLAPSDPAYRGRYGGAPQERDGAYHQGTVWPWLLGPFVQAWLRVHGSDPASRAQARIRFLAPLHAHLDHAGLDHISEVADGDAPHTPGGAPFQAWSLGELLRIESLLAE